MRESTETFRARGRERERERGEERKGKIVMLLAYNTIDLNNEEFDLVIGLDTQREREREGESVPVVNAY